MTDAWNTAPVVARSTHGSDNYRFTVSSLDHPAVATLRLQAAALNKGLKEENVRRRQHAALEKAAWSYTRRFKVEVYGRLGKDSPHAALYSSRRGVNKYYSPKRIRPEHSVRFDVYLREACDWIAS